ncbi:MAG: CBS domain-containing protein [Nanoarchaeota archaeon]
MKVKELMIKNVLTCAKDDSIINVAKKMVDHNVGMLVVIEDNLSKKPIGVLSDRDIISKIVVNKKDPSKITADQISTKKIISVTPELFLDKAVETMNKNKIKRLIVIDDLGNLVGIISKADIIKQFLEIRKQLVDLATFEI